MPAADRAVRKFVYDFFLRQATAPILEEIALGLGVGRQAALRSLGRLDASRHLKLLPGTTRVLMAFPFSAIPTPYRVTRANGQRYFANCAWDAVAFHPMLDEPVWVHSFCRHCARPIRFLAEEGQAHAPEGPLPVLWFGVPAAAWWRDIVRTCSETMVFFASSDHLRAWRAAGDPGGAELTVDQILAISGPIYRRRMRLDYERPAPELLQAEFERAGLTGPFWRLSTTGPPARRGTSS
jgi:hypothetical protein